MDKWCVNAAAALRTSNEGRCNICCMSSQLLKKDNGDFFFVNEDKIEDIWNSNHRKEIENALRNGKEHPNCERCWEEEKAGYVSKRLRDNQNYPYIKSEEVYNSPKLMEFNLGSVCNIRCRTCGPWASSQWAEEFGKLTNQKPKDLIQRYTKRYEDSSIFWDEFEKILPEITYMDFYGGEPFLVKKQWKILEKAIEKGYAKNIGIHYNTNGTIWDEEKVKILQNFKSIRIDFSIDGIDKRFEYMRHPAEWETVKKNLLSACDTFGKNIAICYTVSIYNIYYIDEIMKWATENGILMYLNLLHENQCFNIQNMPNDLKYQIKDKLQKNCLSHYSGMHNLEGIIKYMEHKEYDPEQWKKFFAITEWLDKSRNENFKEVFSEFYELI